MLKDCGTNGRLSESEVRLAQRVAPLQQEKEESSDEWIGLAEKALTGLKLVCTILIFSLHFLKQLYFFFSESITVVKEQISELQGKQNTCTDRLRQMNVTIRATLTAHHQLISDVRSVLKTMAKVSKEAF